MKAAVDSGATLWNGGEFYGTPEYNSMTVLKAYFTKYPEDADKVTLMIKGIIDIKNLRPNGSPESVRRSVDNILAQLGGVKKVDMIGISRRDPANDFRTTLKVLQEEYVDTGKIGGISLSECSAETVHEAAKYVKISAAEIELSMFTQDCLNNGVAAALAEYNIPIVAYSPMGRGVSSSHNAKTCRIGQLTKQSSDPHRAVQVFRGRQAPGLHWHLPPLPGRGSVAQPHPRR